MRLRVLMVNNPQAPFDFRLVCFLSLSLSRSLSLSVLFDFLLLSLLFHLLDFFFPYFLFTCVVYHSFLPLFIILFVLVPFFIL